ncbi:hypothetical protein [uncultured Sphingomonas sp.]|uniref:hypothetical protein n=1 Tax=uncultured Sphingomonas sp. TaxID=158754 RepID=UPI0035C9B119
MPVVTVDDPAVITVYRGGFNFHGHIADALGALEARGSELYLFCQDDLLLHPTLTPASFWEVTNFDRHDGFIPEPESFSGPGREDWPWNDRILTRLLEPTSMLHGGGVEDFTRHLPPVDEARRLFGRYGIESEKSPKPWRPVGDGGLLGQLARRKPTTPALPYPLAVAFSDFFALRRDALRPVGRYLGLFAAMDLFVEVSVATSMILGCRQLAVLKDKPWRVHVDWTDRAELARRAPTDLATLYQAFDDALLYTHPVKLSTIEVTAASG